MLTRRDCNCGEDADILADRCLHIPSNGRIALTLQQRANSSSANFGTEPKPKSCGCTLALLFRTHDPTRIRIRLSPNTQLHCAKYPTVLWALLANTSILRPRGTKGVTGGGVGLLWENLNWHGGWVQTCTVGQSITVSDGAYDCRRWSIIWDDTDQKPLVVSRDGPNKTNGALIRLGIAATRD